jgi:hypothetical protein
MNTTQSAWPATGQNNTNQQQSLFVQDTSFTNRQLTLPFMNLMSTANTSQQFLNQEHNHNLNLTFNEEHLLNQQFDQLKLQQTLNSNMMMMIANNNYNNNNNATFQFKRPITGNVSNKGRFNGQNQRPQRNRSSQQTFGGFLNCSQTLPSPTCSSLLLSTPHQQAKYSRKVFVGGLPPDIDESE